MLLTHILIGVIPVLIVTTGTAIYLNRRKSDRLYQRLFGLEGDPADDGYIPTMNERVENINKNVKELNHDRIDTIENRLDELSEDIGILDSRLIEEEEDNN